MKRLNESKMDCCNRRKFIFRYSLSFHKYCYCLPLPTHLKLAAAEC